MISSNPLAELGEFLTADEALGIATLLGSGSHIQQALNQVSSARRAEARTLMEAAGLGHMDVDRSVAVLNAVSGAKQSGRDSTLVWTMPGNEVDVGHLTGEFHRLVKAARISVTCATYNFETTSKMWDVLKEASEQPGVIVVIYVDGEKADAERLKLRMPKATIYQSGKLPNGKPIVSHAKFVVIDQSVTLLTSANFSYSAEKRNIELGLLMHDPQLSAKIETMMSSKRGSLYELV
jgi:phosphatidylserine/phosphatidylglycerophosphate/cardiolipin synthase-like enzyme